MADESLRSFRYTPQRNTRTTSQLVRSHHRSFPVDKAIRIVSHYQSTPWRRTRSTRATGASLCCPTCSHLTCVRRRSYVTGWHAAKAESPASVIASRAREFHWAPPIRLTILRPCNWHYMCLWKSHARVATKGATTSVRSDPLAL